MIEPELNLNEVYEWMISSLIKRGFSEVEPERYFRRYGETILQGIALDGLNGSPQDIIKYSYGPMEKKFPKIRYSFYAAPYWLYEETDEKRFRESLQIHCNYRDPLMIRSAEFSQANSDTVFTRNPIMFRPDEISDTPYEYLTMVFKETLRMLDLIYDFNSYFTRRRARTFHLWGEMDPAVIDYLLLKDRDTLDYYIKKNKALIETQIESKLDFFSEAAEYYRKRIDSGKKLDDFEYDYYMRISDRDTIRQNAYNLQNWYKMRHDIELPDEELGHVRKRLRERAEKNREFYAKVLNFDFGEIDV